MDSFELNKIAGAVLGTLLFVMGVGFVAEAIYQPIEGHGPGYPLPEPEGTVAAAHGDTGAPAEPVAIATLLASANADDGARSARKCQSCHDFTEGGPNKTGPNLYGTVERQIASHPGYSYSAPLAERGAAGETWTYENLSAFIASPKGFAPGTKMTFAGIKDDAERANLIAYMRTLSPNPVPLPAAPAATEPPAVDSAPVATDVPAIPTQTETQSETPVVGTPTNSGTPGTGTSEPAVPTQSGAPAQPAAPAGTQQPAPADGQATPNANSAPPGTTAPTAPTNAPAGPETTTPLNTGPTTGG